MQHDVDAVVIGAGFAGLYAVHKLRDDMGLRVQGFEAGDGVGGTWFWNRYPGARCDSESFYYCYSFSKELAHEWEWSGRYPEQPEIEHYLNHVADRFDLRRSIELSTRVTAACFNDATNRWTITTEHGHTVTSQFVISAVGCLSTPLQPDLPGLDNFAGPIVYTATWPREGVDLAGKRVGLIGTGSSGIQATPPIAQVAEHLTVFQRTANFSIPARHRTFDPEHQRQIKQNYDEIFATARASAGGFPYAAIERKTMEVPDDERRAILDGLWEEGGFRFLWGGFCDLLRDPEANEIASNYVRDRIRETVRDPETAELLCPKGYPYGAKRPPIDTDYYATFNRDNVSLVDVKANPIVEVLPHGVRTTAGEHDLDVLVFATGFDAMTGTLLRIDITGRDGVSLRDVWGDGPQSYLGLQVAGFPNFFTITGPGSPSVLTNMPVSIEYHVEWIADCIAWMVERGHTRIEATVDAQHEWADHVVEAAFESLMTKANSWYIGANVPGKPRRIMPYAGGQQMYRERADGVRAAGYRGFRFS